jgi:hypothetical protein
MNKFSRRGYVPGVLLLDTCVLVGNGYVVTARERKWIGINRWRTYQSFLRRPR